MKDLKKLASEYSVPKDLTTSINSGSFKFEAMAIVPCTMKTLVGNSKWLC